MMRIIAGEFRGRKLLGPVSETTRPVTDRVKQSIFDIVAPRMHGATIYDCFAGTGSMGLESLSRGAAEVTFFEADRSAAARLGQNIAALKVGNRSRIVTTDLFAWIRTARRGSADLIFLDPPYRLVRERPRELQQLVGKLAPDHLTPCGTVIFRHDSRDQLDLPPLARFDVRNYGSMIVEFLSGGCGSL